MTTKGLKKNATFYVYETATHPGLIGMARQYPVTIMAQIYDGEWYNSELLGKMPELHTLDFEEPSDEVIGYFGQLNRDQIVDLITSFGYNAIKA